MIKLWSPSVLPRQQSLKLLPRPKCIQERFITLPPGVAPATPEVRAARDYCAELLQNHDAPANTLVAFIPPDCRTAYLAIRAFNIELARIPDTVSTPTIGAIRYQFWRDNISDAFNGRPRKQPVSLLLARVLEILHARTERSATMSKNWLMRIISARAQYSDGRPYPSLESLEKYAENTYSTLMYLTLQSLPMNSLAADHIASHIGKASGIVAVLRGLPLVAFPLPPNHHSNSGPLGGSLERGKQGAVMLPLDVMARAGVKEEDVLRQGPQALGLRDAVFEVATRANDHLITAREMLKNVRKGQDVGHAYEHQDDAEREYASIDEGTLSKEQRQLQDVERAYGILMEAVAAQSWLDRLQKADFDVFSTKMRKKDWKLPFKTYAAYRKRQI